MRQYHAAAAMPRNSGASANATAHDDQSTDISMWQPDESGRNCQQWTPTAFANDDWYELVEQPINELPNACEQSAQPPTLDPEYAIEPNYLIG